MISVCVARVLRTPGALALGMLVEAAQVSAAAKEKGVVASGECDAITLHMGIHAGVSLVVDDTGGSPSAQGEGPSAALQLLRLARAGQVLITGSVHEVIAASCTPRCARCPYCLAARSEVES